ncbi:very short patch repair endonuclease [Amycolatopsis sp. lyj-84]|uniref:very short patch repair endonuclease n=1 Tax=Amycolatopsis sp. lyj-84 TaxID=2789284 RepID=UPI0039788E6B
MRRETKNPASSSPTATARLSRQPQRDTALELEVRRHLHSSGYRYRLQIPVPGRPRRTIDVCFPSLRVAVFLDGCFWHGCPDHGTSPKSNSRWWREKIEANRVRDNDTTKHLNDLGWVVVRYWEHDLPSDIAGLIGHTVNMRKAELGLKPR